MRGYFKSVIINTVLFIAIAGLLRNSGTFMLRVLVLHL